MSLSFVGPEGSFEVRWIQWALLCDNLCLHGVGENAIVSRSRPAPSSALDTFILGGDHGVRWISERSAKRYGAIGGQLDSLARIIGGADDHAKVEVFDS